MQYREVQYIEVQYSEVQYSEVQYSDLHCTVLSQACEAARLNFEEYLRGAKKRCRCGTKECPNWMCQCSEDEDTEEMGPCTCRPCNCDLCSSCKVT